MLAIYIATAVAFIVSVTALIKAALNEKALNASLEWLVDVGTLSEDNKDGLNKLTKEVNTNRKKLKGIAEDLEILVEDVENNRVKAERARKAKAQKARKRKRTIKKGREKIEGTVDTALKAVANVFNKANKTIEVNIKKLTQAEEQPKQREAQR